MTTDRRADPAADSPSPGSSGPGEPGYDEEVGIGDDASPGYPDDADDPFGRPGPPLPADR